MSSMDWNTMDDKVLNEKLSPLWGDSMARDAEGRRRKPDPCVYADDAFEALDRATDRKLITSWEISDRTIRIMKSGGHPIEKDYFRKNRQIVICQALAEAIDQHLA